MPNIVTVGKELLGASMGEVSPRVLLITLRAKLNGAVYCYRSCLWRAGGVCGWVCYHDNSKLRASIFTKLSL